jgi:hypothetical protein
VGTVLLVPATKAASPIIGVAQATVDVIGDRGLPPDQ